MIKLGNVDLPSSFSHNSSTASLTRDPVYRLMYDDDELL